jgi:glycosyltransferase involved in cell wall biosynthesis
VIELYAVTDPPGVPLPGAAAARVLPSGRLAVVYAPAPDADADDPAEALWRHEELVEALMEHGDVLPFRYGTRCEDVRAVACAVSKREAELRSALERIRGAVELSVRALVGQPSQQPSHTGESAADYLAARTRAAVRAQAVSDAVHEPLRAVARASRVRAADSPSEQLRAAYLVDRDRVDDFVRAVAALQQRRPDLRLLCTGPWPPYSFTEP